MSSYKFCPEHNGIEIYFERKPDSTTIQKMKDNGWRWHHGKECWYNSNSSSNLNFAKKICVKNEKEPELKPKKIENIEPVVAITGKLIRCVDCGKSISARAALCLGCGAPMQYIIETYEKERVRQEQLKLQLLENKRQEEERQRAIQKKIEIERKERERKAEIERKKIEAERQKELERKRREEEADRAKIADSFRNRFSIGTGLSDEKIYSIYQYLNTNATKISEWNYKFRDRTVIDVGMDENGKIYFRLYKSQYEREKLYMVEDEKKRYY